MGALSAGASSGRRLRRGEARAFANCMAAGRSPALQTAVRCAAMRCGSGGGGGRFISVGARAHPSLRAAPREMLPMGASSGGGRSLTSAWREFFVFAQHSTASAGCSARSSECAPKACATETATTTRRRLRPQRAARAHRISPPPPTPPLALQWSARAPREAENRSMQRRPLVLRRRPHKQSRRSARKHTGLARSLARFIIVEFGRPANDERQQNRLPARREQQERPANSRSAPTIFETPARRQVRSKIFRHQQQQRPSTNVALKLEAKRNLVILLLLSLLLLPFVTFVFVSHRFASESPLAKLGHGISRMSLF